LHVFIGSSTDGASDLETVEKLLHNAYLVPRPWSTPGEFPPSVGIWERLVQIAAEVHAGAFIFREDDSATIKGDSRAITRDNVILECGLFSGILGRHRCAVFKKGKPWVPADFGGIVLVSLDDLERAQLEVNAWARSLRANNVLPFQFTLEQVGAVCRAMQSSGIPMNRIYSLMLKLGVGSAHINHCMQARRAPTS